MHVLITRWRHTFSLPSSDQLIQLGNLWFARELWWHKTHVKVKINIVVCGQFDRDFPPPPIYPKDFESQGMAASRAAHFPHILRASRQLTAAARHNAACRRVFCALPPNPWCRPTHPILCLDLPIQSVVRLTHWSVWFTHTMPSPDLASVSTQCLYQNKPPDVWCRHPPPPPALVVQP